MGLRLPSDRTGRASEHLLRAAPCQGIAMGHGEKSRGKIKPLFTRAPTSVSPSLAHVPLEVPLSRPSPPAVVSAGGRLAGCAPRATRSARRAAGACAAG